MPTSTNVTNLKINELTEAQYDTAVQGGVIGANELSIITDLDDVIQVDVLPTASATEEGKIYQFTGTTTASYTNGYFYKCVSDGQQPATYSWTQTDVQPQAGGLPSQTGNAGKFLTTDGTDASWSDTVSQVSLVNSTYGKGVFDFGGQYCEFVAYNTSNVIKFVWGYDFANNKFVMRHNGGTWYYFDKNNFYPSVQNGYLGSSSYKWTSVYTTKLNNGSDITVPAVAGSMAVQVSTIPTAASTLEGQIYQFVGATDSTYTNGYFYKCVSDGQTPATYSWEAVQVQAGGGSSLPSQTGNSGKFLTTDGTDASWATISALQNTATGTGSLCVGTGIAGGNYALCVNALNAGADYTVALGYRAYAYKINAIGIGGEAYSYSTNSISIGRLSQTGKAAMDVGEAVAIGYSAKVLSYGCIQLGHGSTPDYNSDPGTLWIGLYTSASTGNNYKLLDANGTIPTDRFTTTPSADGTYVPTLTISSGVATRSWAAPSGGGGGSATSTTATLATADWSSNTQTVNVTGVTASNNVIVSAAPASQTDYTAAGVICTSQGSGTLTFTCTTTPSSALTVNVLII